MNVTISLKSCGLQTNFYHHFLYIKFRIIDYDLVYMSAMTNLLLMSTLDIVFKPFFACSQLLRKGCA